MCFSCSLYLQCFQKYLFLGIRVLFNVRDSIVVDLVCGLLFRISAVIFLWWSLIFWMMVYICVTMILFFENRMELTWSYSLIFYWLVVNIVVMVSIESTMKCLYMFLLLCYFL